MIKKKILFISYGLVLVALFLYSFTQVDLSLTFSRMPFIRAVVDSSKHIGYFQRPLSAGIYLTILSLLFIFYAVFLYLAHKGVLTKKEVLKLILGSGILLLFSYNAFSYDLFNYIFDAKIITHYHQNPYIQKALDYPNDPMLTFMHWTHRTYPYGPVWLIFTVPLSFLGFNFFIPTFFFFKALMAGSFVASAYFIGKILQKTNPKKEVLGLVFFGLQPLLLIECLVSAHIDIVMMMFALWAVYLLLKKQYVRSSILFIVSIGIKFATLVLAPIFLILFWYQKRGKTPVWGFVFFLATVLMVITTIVASTRTNFQPWYLVGPLTFAAFLVDSPYIIVASILISFFAMLTYLPFLYLGNWDPPVPNLLTIFYQISYMLSLICIAGIFIYRRIRKR